MSSIIQQIMSGEYSIIKRGDFLTKYATPLFCIETAMRNIAHHVASDTLKETLSDAAQGVPDAIERFRQSHEYVRILKHMMEDFEQNVLPAAQRLYALEYGESEDEG